MTFNELVAWVISKPRGRILIERSPSKRTVDFYLSCESPVGDPPQIVGLERRIDLRELYFLRGKQSVEDRLGLEFDAIKEDFEEFIKNPEEKT